MFSRQPTANFNTTPPSIARSATGSVYDKGDTGFTTPLNMTLVIGGAVVTTISSDALGFLPDFTLLDRVNCVWKQTGASFATVLTTSDPIPGPAGPNTVPTDTAIASNISTPGTATAGALNATYVPKWKPNTAYLAGDAVLSPAGDTVTAKANFTSAASFSAANWNYSGTYATPAAVAVKVDSAALSSPVPGYVPFVDRLAGGYATGSTTPVLSNGTDTAAASRIMHTAMTDGTNVRLFFGNFSGASDGTSPITVQAVLESPVDAVTLSTVATPVFPVLFNGQTSVVIPPTGIGVWSDPIPMRVKKGQRIYSRTLVTVSSGGKWNESLTTQTYNGEGAVRGAGATASLLTAGTSVPTNTITCYGPSVIVALPNAGTSPRTLGVAGDSIAAGSGESGPDVGYFVRAAGASSIALVNVARPGELAVNFQGLGKRNRAAVLATVSDVIYEYARNDLSNGQTLAQMQANMISDWQFFAALGKVVRQTTITPYSTSTDAWITTGNQTAGNANAIRLQLNAWIRDGAPINSTTAAPLATGTVTNAIRAGAAGHPLRGYVEITDLIESARDSGVWKPAKKALTDAAMTSGSTTLTSASAAFTAADVNTAVVVRGAGAAGADLLARLASVTNGTTAVLNAAAGTTVSGAAAGIGVRTFDGLHPSLTGHTEIAAGLNLATILAS